MSKENVILVILAVVLCVLNLLFIDPVSSSIARFFARISADTSHRKRNGAGRPSPPGPEEPPAMREAQISKYR
jgi:hypothetical protein